MGILNGWKIWKSWLWICLAVCLQFSEQVCTSYCYWQQKVGQDTVVSHWNCPVVVGDTWSLCDWDTWTLMLLDTWLLKTRMTPRIQNLLHFVPSNYSGTLSLCLPPSDGPSTCCQIGMSSFPRHQRGWSTQSWTCYFQVIYNFICLIWGFYFIIFECATHEYSCSCEAAAPAVQFPVILDSSFEGMLPTLQFAEL